jgi:hypothetical protein
MFGFSDKASLDEGDVWPTTSALKKLTRGDEARIGALVKAEPLSAQAGR